MSEEKKSTGRFHINLFDVVLILLAVLCVVGIWQRDNLQSLFEDEQVNDVYTVSFEIRGLRDDARQYLTPGTRMYVQNGDSRVLLGSIAGEPAVVDAAVYLPYYDQITGQTTLVEAYYPDDYSTVKAVLSSHGLEHDGVFFAAGEYNLSVNQSITVYTEYADFEIFVTAITKVG